MGIRHSLNRTVASFALALFVGLAPGAAALQEAGETKAPRSVPSPDVAAYRSVAERILAAAMADHSAWERLTELTDTFGPRLSGSPGLEAALRWSASTLRRDGLDEVRLEKVMVPRWIRGEERAAIVEPFPSSLVMAGLGMSVGTPPEGITAEVLVVSDFEELERRKAEVSGKIVLIDFTYRSYGEDVKYRLAGASRAARLGARALLIRSVGPRGLRTVHTGVLQYADDAPRIPAAALAHEDASRLRRIAARGQRLVVRLEMQARTEPDVESANLVAELKGTTRPDEILLFGCHSDSWDLGTGAMDDGAGCILVWEAFRVLKRLELRPRRTLRMVFFVNEENGTRGGKAYLEAHRHELARHLLAFEADSGGFRPTGFAFSGSDAARRSIEAVAALLAPLRADEVTGGGGGVDIDPLVKAGSVPALSLKVDTSRYMLYHHTAADTPESQDPEDLARCVGAVATMAFVLADLPGSFAAARGELP